MRLVGSGLALLSPDGREVLTRSGGEREEFEPPCSGGVSTCMKRLVLLRHGESVWNCQNRFTGWVDVPLSEQGRLEAARAGRLLREEGFAFSHGFTSYLRRAVSTLHIVLEEMGREWIPVEKSWRLNERHAGVLQGWNKGETAHEFGDALVKKWCAGYRDAPPALADGDVRCARAEEKYAEVPAAELPNTESMADTVERVRFYWDKAIEPTLISAREAIVVAHGNSVRALVKIIRRLSPSATLELAVPRAIPLVIELDNALNYKRDYRLNPALPQPEVPGEAPAAPPLPEERDFS